MDEPGGESEWFHGARVRALLHTFMRILDLRKAAIPVGKRPLWDCDLRYLDADAIRIGRDRCRRIWSLRCKRRACR